MKAMKPQYSIMDFIPVESRLPDSGQEVLARGWGENRERYVYDLSQYLVTTASKRWITRYGATLHFEPIEWARLPQPESSVR
jgi:hypothetical protein